MEGTETVKEPRLYGFSRERRLRKRSDFAGVYARGRSWSHPLVRLRVIPNQLALTRLGFVVGKVVGKAVVRNRLKRRLREMVRYLTLRPGHDVIISGRPPAVQSNAQELREALLNVLGRARLIDGPERVL